MSTIETYNMTDLESMGVNPTNEPISQLSESQPFDPRTLKIYEHESDIQSALASHQAVILISPTGTGKTTQVPKIAHKMGFDLVQNTQPRRRPAINAGSRILAELSVEYGEERAREMISWQTGAGLEGPRNAPIQIMTEGVLLNKHRYRPTKGDNELWVLDEVHEQGRLLEVLMGRAKERIAGNPDFTTVFMSANVDKYGLVSYLTNEYGQEPAVIELTAEMYPVEFIEAPKSNAIKECLKAAKDISENPEAHGGSYAIQIFEPGLKEIKDTISELRLKLPQDILSKTKLLANHAKMSPTQQAPVYEPLQEGIKIVVQTNIGKTSNTIPGTRCVITAGTERQIFMDDEATTSLLEVQISQDDINQQKGRTGRNNSGYCVLVGRDGERFLPLAERDQHMTPEIQRTPLDDITLMLAGDGDSIRTFDFRNMPNPEQIEFSIGHLQALGALDGAERITELGKQMINFPAGPEGQRCMAEASQYPERIRAFMAVMVAAVENGGLKRVVSEDMIAGWKALTDESGSDMLSQLDIFIATQGMSRKDKAALDINMVNIDRIQEAFVKLTHRSGVEELPLLTPPTNDERALLRRCIIAGYINSIYIPKGEGQFEKYGGSGILREISNRSVVSRFTREAVLGIAHNIQIYKNGKPILLPIIDTNMTVSMDEIAKFAPDKTGWIAEGLTLREGKFVLVERQIFGRRVIGGMRETPAVPSPLVRAACIEHVRTSPGPTLIYLYKIKKELESLAKRSTTFNCTLTNDLIEDMIKTAAPDTIIDPSLIEENLRQRVLAEQLSLESYISQKEQDRIIRNAPDELLIGDGKLRLSYTNGKPAIMMKSNYNQQGQPTARHLNDITLFKQLPLDLTLRDGRPIAVVYNNKRYTIEQMHRELQIEQLI